MPTLEELFPINIAERPLRIESAETNPGNLLRSELARVALAHRDQCDQFLATLAVTAFQLSRLVLEADPASDSTASLREGLEIIQANLTETLQQHGVEVRDLTGRPFSTVDQELVDVRGQRVNSEITETAVWHMEQPVVIRAERCLVRGAVTLEAPLRQ